MFLSHIDISFSLSFLLSLKPLNIYLRKDFFKKRYTLVGPGRPVQLVRVSSQYAKSAGLIPGQGTKKNQSTNA